MSYTTKGEGVIQIIPVQSKHFEQFIEALPEGKRKWLQNSGFKANSGELCLLPNKALELEEVYLGIKDEFDGAAVAQASSALKSGCYQFKTELHFSAMLFWGLAHYKFDRYLENKENKPSEKTELLVSEALCERLQKALKAHCLVRDLINTPAEDLSPMALLEVSKELASHHGATCRSFAGETLQKEYPAIHAVGRGADFSPCLIELDWNDDKALPLLTLVGKGVCFDTGGLDLKPSSNMRIMKKDMGGAAHVLGLAELIMSHKLPIRLKVLIPAVENAISGNAYRPGDIIKTRQGLSVEIDNTDAEGRVVMSDALTYATESNPELIIDFATLTGAARVALGTEIAAMFCNSESVAKEIRDASLKTCDWVWQLPLFQPYLKQIQPGVADLANSAKTGFGGAITAALFLEQFVGKTPWVHFDIMAWNKSSTPGKPEGGEALGLHAVFSYLQKRFAL